MLITAIFQCQHIMDASSSVLEKYSKRKKKKSMKYFKFLKKQMKCGSPQVQNKLLLSFTPSILARILLQERFISRPPHLYAETAKLYCMY